MYAQAAVFQAWIYNRICAQAFLRIVVFFWKDSESCQFSTTLFASLIARCKASAKRRPDFRTRMAKSIVSIVVDCNIWPATYRTNVLILELNLHMSRCSNHSTISNTLLYRYHLRHVKHDDPKHTKHETLHIHSQTQFKQNGICVAIIKIH